MDNKAQIFMSTDFSFVDEFEQEFRQRSKFNMEVAEACGESHSSMLVEKFYQFMLGAGFTERNIVEAMYNQIEHLINPEGK